MSEFLAIGIATKVQIHPVPSEAEAYEALQKGLAERGAGLSIYTGQVYDDVWDGQLQQEVVEAELLDFLKAVYAQLRLFTRLDDAEKVIAAFEGTPPEAWLDKLSEASFYNLQNDAYAQGRDLKIEGRDIQLRFVSAMLVMRGKIILETDGGLFDLFAAALQAQLNQFRLAEALRVYITG